MASAAATRIEGFWSHSEGSQTRTVFAARGIRCTSCSKAIERAIGALPGVLSAQVNVATARVSVTFNSSIVTLPVILKTTESAGFQPVPLLGERSQASFQRERRMALKRIGLAGIGMMQVMMYVLGVYVAGPDSMDPAIASYLKYVGLLITTPVLLYSGAPYLLGAWQDLRRRTLGMDVPVAVALCLAYFASVVNTVRGSGQTYFDSVTMFIFFLGAGRYLEMVVRQRSLSLREAVGRSLPAQVSRVRSDGSRERVDLVSIIGGDRIAIPKGGVIPVDARLTEGQALVDESLLTGEAKPARKSSQDWIPGGALNLTAPIIVTAQGPSSSSTLASIVALLERAQLARPAVARTADRIANRFIATILLFAVAVAVTWTLIDPARAFPAALAVLVVTCPCALSLATPLAVAAASMRLARDGMLVTRADALERLAQVDTLVMDKTGTLTSGRPSIANVSLLRDVTEADALAGAAALERDSSHPIASAFAPHARSETIAVAVDETPGQGITGIISGRHWKLGRRAFVTGIAGETGESDDSIFLVDENGPVASFQLIEELRPQAAETLRELQALGIHAVLASGDRADAVQATACALDIPDYRARLSPEQKLNIVRELQHEGRHVLMVGDGVNDGPVLAAANVSCAMSEGSAIAHAAADLMLMSPSLEAVANSITTARQMRSTIRGNLIWALGYNILAIPLAALDLVPPWLAALGMSASSLIVVLNARRLTRRRFE